MVRKGVTEMKTLNFEHHKKIVFTVCEVFPFIYSMNKFSNAHFVFTPGVGIKRGIKPWPFISIILQINKALTGK